MDFLKNQQRFTSSLFFSSEGVELGGEAAGGRGRSRAGCCPQWLPFLPHLCLAGGGAGAPLAAFNREVSEKGED